ncbi:MAG: cysG [Magnetococcales bacterium]|nr:cysG [Magnetococcales bacterium]
MKNKACLLVGTGQELLRKGNLLLDAGARLKLISPPEMVALWPQHAQPAITWLATTFEPRHLDDVWLVVSTHSSHPLNLGIRQEAERRGIFVNVVDQPEFCSAIWPAMISRPPVCVAISTGGTGPVLSGWIRQKIEKQLPDNLGEMALWFARMRQRMTPNFSSLEQRSSFWKKLFSLGVLDRFLSGDPLGAEQMVQDAMQDHIKKMTVKKIESLPSDQS